MKEREQAAASINFGFILVSDELHFDTHSSLMTQNKVAATGRCNQTETKMKQKMKPTACSPPTKNQDDRPTETAAVNATYHQ